MLDIKFLRDQLETTVAKLQTRGFTFNVEHFTGLEKQRKTLQVALQELQNIRNTRSKAIGIAKSKGEDASALMQEVQSISTQLTDHEQQLKLVQEQLNAFLSSVPNLPNESVPIGRDEKDNKLMHQWGKKPEFSFKPLEHIDLGEKRGLMDFACGAKLTGARFVVLKGALARLQRALTQFMLDTHTTQHGYQEVYVPFIVNAESLFGTGQLPKFAEDQFALQGDQNYYLIPTAEVPVTNFARDEIWPLENLPAKFVAHTPCFRSEAGSYGKDMRGMIRNHQFEKVELVQLCKPEESWQAHEALTRHAETILELLELPYQRLLLCTGDMGFGSAKTYDLEVWLPGQNAYREISSCSHYTDFQARRMQARWRAEANSKPELLHTLNGSGLAVGRTLIAIMENYQNEEGTIRVPKVLQQYVGCEFI